MTMPITDEELADVRDSAEHADWCIVCASMIDHAGCRKRSFPHEPVSVLSVLARIGEGEQ
jgi:hypothetical protein